MKVKVLELSSGFANISNPVVLADNCPCVSDRPGSAYDSEYIIELSSDYEIAEMYGGGLGIFRGDKHIELCSVDLAKKCVVGVSPDGFVRFPIVD